jgi:hypothetical protein
MVTGNASSSRVLLHHIWKQYLKGPYSLAAKFGGGGGGGGGGVSQKQFNVITRNSENRLSPPSAGK